MAKPIFIIKFPTGKTMELTNDVIKRAKEGMSDYHVLFVPIENAEFQFECYNSEKVNDIDFDLLQKRVLELAKLSAE